MTLKKRELIKWVKNREISFNSIIYSFRESNNFMTLTREDKAQTSIEFFFLSFVTTRLDDISDIEYWKNISFSKITKAEITTTIKNCFSNKISKENDVLNRIIKLFFFTSCRSWNKYSTLICNVNITFNWYVNQSQCFFRKFNKSNYFILKT